MNNPDGSQGFSFGFRAAILSGQILNPLNTTMISVAIVPISRDLGLEMGSVFWIVIVLYLVSAVIQPAMGALVDAFGPRLIYMLGLVLVALGGVIPIIWEGFTSALIARVMLGLATASAYPSAFGLIRDEEKRTKATAPPALLAALSVASFSMLVLGPPLGGVLVWFWGWKAIFFINLPLASIALLLAIVLIPKPQSAPKSVRASAGESSGFSIDFVGMILFGTVLSGVILVLLGGLEQSFWASIVVAGAVIAFLAWCFWKQDPYIDLRILAPSGRLGRTYVRLFLCVFGPLVITYGLTQWLQIGLDFTSQDAGILQVPSAILAGLISFAGGRLLRFYLPLLTAPILLFVGGVLLTTFSAQTPLWLIVLTTALFGVPHGLSSVLNQALLYRWAPGSKVGMVAGLSRTVTSVAAILVSCLVGTLFDLFEVDEVIHYLGWGLACVSVLVFLVTLLDRELRRYPG